MSGRVYLAQADGLEWLRSLPDGCAGVVCTDPAYEALDKHRAVGTTTRLDGWFPTVSDAVLVEYCHELARVLADDGHLYMFLAPETAIFVGAHALRDAGLTFWRQIIWDRMAMGMGYGWRRGYEPVLAFRGPRGASRRPPTKDVIDVQRFKSPTKALLDGREPYPTEKPVDLLRVILYRSARPGDLVIDPFLGSGSTGVAAMSLGLDFAGVDVQPEAVELARSRMAGAGELVLPQRVVHAQQMEMFA